jgi:LEA14-like dessication related protein
MATKTGTKVLAVVGGLSIGAFLLKQAADKILSNIIVTVGTPQLDSSPFADGYLKSDVPVTIENYNPFPLGLEYFAGRVNYGELKLTNISILTPISIPANSTRTITLDLDIPIQSVLNDVIGLLQGGSIFSALINPITLNGALQVQGNISQIPIPLNDIRIPIV